MQADATVEPGDQERDRLLHAFHRIEHPDGHDDVSVKVLDAEKLVQPAVADDVDDQERRDRQAGDDLQRLAQRHAQRAAAKDGVEDEPEMDQERNIENQGTRGIAPHRQEH